MHINIKLISLLCLLILLSGCGKINVDQNDLFQTWVVKQIEDHENETVSSKINDQILLTFNTDNTYSLKLEINNCGGTINSIIEDQINMTRPACTEACCDSEFSEHLTQLMYKVHSFGYKRKWLYLYYEDGLIRTERAE